MQIKYKPLIYAFCMFVAFSIMPFNDASAQRTDVVIPEGSNPPTKVISGNFWQEGYNDGYAMGKQYSTTPQVHPGMISVLDELRQDGRNLIVTWKQVKYVTPNTSQYEGMARLYARLRDTCLESGYTDMFQYYDGAVHGIYDGWVDNGSGYGGGGGSGIPGVSTGPGGLVANPQEP